MTAKRGTHSLTYLCSAHVSILALKTSLLVRTSLLESGVILPQPGDGMEFVIPRASVPLRWTSKEFIRPAFADEAPHP
jgi:hypothetical protein